MLEKDYILDEIQNFVRFLAKILFNKDTVVYVPAADSATASVADNIYKEINVLVDKGEICQAEDLLFENFSPNDFGFLEMAVDFYNRLGEYDEEYLNEHNFSRKEVYQGLQDIAKLAGINIDF